MKKPIRLSELPIKRLFRFDYDPNRIYTKDTPGNEWCSVTTWGYYDTYEKRWIASPNAEQEQANPLAMVFPIEVD